MSWCLGAYVFYVTNSALYGSFPLSNTDKSNLYSSIRSYLTTAGFSLSLLTNIDVYVG